MKHAATCHQCRKQLVVDAHDDCPIGNIDTWLRIIVCNRCGDYLEKRRSITESVQRICNQVSTGVMPKTKASDPLTKITQEFVQLLTKHWTTTNDWSPEFVDMILEQPAKATIALRFHESEHRKARQQADRKT